MAISSIDQREAGREPVLAADALLHTKLVLPPVRAKRVGRGRLNDKLNGGLDKSLILVSAPAGYGKTTLVSAWLRETPLLSTWLSLDDGDNEPHRFLQYLVAALRTAVPAIPADAAKMLQGASTQSVEALLTVLINQVSGQAGPLVLALDDLHLVRAPQVLQALSFLLEHAPPNLHVVLLTRSDPALPIARLRARNQVLDIRAQDLRFDRDEVSAFLRDVMDLKLAAEDIAAVEARTEGWIAGLQLAALSMQGGRDAHGFVEQFAGRQEYLVDYLVQEVLEAQPAEISTFLLQTACLGRICAALCEAVLQPQGRPAGSARAMLERLDQLNLFITPLDEARSWYRYHHLFADVLNKRLRHVQPELARQIEARAAAWHEANGSIPEAIHHSIAAGDHENAARLIEQNGCKLLIRGEVLTLSGWLDALKEYESSRPWFPVYRGWIASLTGQPERVEEHLRRADDLIAAMPSGTDASTIRGAAAGARAHQANVQGNASRAAAFAREALTHLTAQDDTACSMGVVAISLLGDASSINGDLDTAWESYSRAIGATRSIGDVHLTIVLNSNLGNVLEEKGQLRRAAEIYRETIQLAALPGGQMSAIGGRACIELAQLCYEWNHLDEAADLTARGLALCEIWGSRDKQALGSLLQARMSLARSAPEAARKWMDETGRLMREFRLGPLHTARTRPGLAHLWLRQGDLQKAAEVLDASAIAPDSEITYLRESELTMWVRLELARAEFDAALRLTERLLPAPEAGGRQARVIELLTLKALAHHGLGQTGEALGTLRRALALAGPEGYVRTFVDEGEALARLLYLQRSGDGGGYAAELLAILQAEHGTETTPVQLLPEPLTARELEILKLINGGCSNRDIAAQLYISPATVKRHISNIYLKLSVGGRTQALARSRELGLLD